MYNTEASVRVPVEGGGAFFIKSTITTEILYKIIYIYSIYNILITYFIYLYVHVDIQSVP